MATLKPLGRWLDYTVEEWSNGAQIEFILYDEPLEGEDQSDQIHMLVTFPDGEKRGLLMNIEDAACIVRGLSRLLHNAITVNKPISGSKKIIEDPA